MADFIYTDEAGEFKISPDSLDRTGRLIIANTKDLGAFNLLDDKNPEFIDEEIIGTATSTHSVNDSTIDMEVSANLDAVIRETFQSFPYEPGKEMRIWHTFARFEPQANTIKRIGYFTSNTVTPFDSDKDGIWLESDDTTVYLVVCKNGTNTSKIPQSSWDDPLDGTGASGQTIDWTKAQVMTLEFLWLGTDGVTLSFKLAGVVYKVHSLNYENVLDTTYMRSPDKPLRYEIRATGASTGLFRLSCSAVEILGSSNRTFRRIGLQAYDGAPLSIAAGAVRPLLAFRLAPSYKDKVVVVDTFDAMSTTTANFRIFIARNPTVNIGGVPTAWSALTFPNSVASIEYRTFTNADTVSDYLDKTKYSISVSNNSDSGKSSIADGEWAGSKIDGTRDVYVLCVFSEASDSYKCSMNLKEFR